MPLVEINLSVVSKKKVTRLTVRHNDSDSNIALALVSLHALLDIQWEALADNKSG